jgi:alpha-ribazole phosphatase/probable phosphoglycerate mutase
MSHVLFIRHAETEMAGRFCGHSDPDVNAQGRSQLSALAGLLSAEAIDGVYSSDLRRAISTADAIAAARKIPLALRPALREINFGQWEGLSWKQIEQRDPEYARTWMDAFPRIPAPAGESFHAFEARILEEVSHLLEPKPGPIAVVTHGGVLRVVLRHLCGCSEPEAWRRTQPYCCIVRYEAKGEDR